jgi:hypothetical protein
MMSKNRIRYVLKRTSMVQVDSIWMKLETYNFGAKGSDIMLRLVPPSLVEATHIAVKTFSCTSLLHGRVEKGDELVLEDGTRLKFCKLQPIPLDDDPKPNSLSKR